jgi:hypothetical protein
MLEGGNEDCYPGNWLFALPQTGSYQVSFDRAGGRHGIAFTLLERNDPVVDPGVRSDQIAIDFGAFSQGNPIVDVPLNKACDESEPWPSHIALKTNQFEFRIMTVAGYKKMLRANELDHLQATLAAGGKNALPKQLPYHTYKGAGLNLSTEPHFIQGDGWRGVRWIGLFGQDITCNLALDGEDSAYFLEGMSNDNQFFILIRAAISNPALGHHISQSCVSAQAESPTRNIDMFFEKEMPVLFTKDVAAAASSSFQPRLDELDAVSKSLRFK